MRYRAVGIRLLLGTALALAAPAVAQAAQTVTNTNDSGTGSLRAAIAAASSGDTINFDSSLNGQTITLTTGPLMITQSLTISGPGAGNLTITNATVNGTSDFDVNIVPSTSTSVTISGLTITGGHARDTGGGAIDASSVATLNLNGDVITGNSATLRTNGSFGGGGVFVDGGTVNVTNSTVSNNTVTFTDNVTGANPVSGGGGLYSNGGAVTVTGSDVSNNTVDLASTSAESGGGGIFSNSRDVDVSASSVNGNSVQIDASSGGEIGRASCRERV